MMTLDYYHNAEKIDAELRHQRYLAHKRRCKSLPPVTGAEIEQLVQQFLARNGGVTKCPPAYVARVQ